MSIEFRGEGRKRWAVSNHFEPLESRRLLSIGTIGVPAWEDQGPEGLGIGDDYRFSGAVNSVAVDPTNADRLFVATVSGGIWRTSNATAAIPHWEPLIDLYPSLSVADIRYSPRDPTRNTLFAAIGNSSSGGLGSNSFTGLLKTTDGGNTWLQIANGSGGLGGRQVTQILPTRLLGLPGGGQLVFAATAGINPGDGNVFRSTDGGNTFAIAGGGLPSNFGFQYAGAIIIADPAKSDRFYVSIPANGIYKTEDAGVTWTLVNNAAITALMPGGAGNPRANIIQLAVHNSVAGNVLYAAIWQGQNLAGVFYSSNQGVSWTQMGAIPKTNPVKEGAIAVDQTQPNVVFLGTGTGGWYRGDTSLAAGSQWTAVFGAGAGGTQPHADVRSLATAANGDIFITDDGGISRLTDPNNVGGSRKWVSVAGDMGAIELQSVAYDSNSDVIFGGSQDNGSEEQRVGGWKSYLGGDGGIQAVDSSSPVSYRYSMSNNMAIFFRRSSAAPDTLIPIKLAAPATPTVALSGLRSGELINGYALVPYVINAADPTRMLISYVGLYESANRGDTITDISPGGFIPGPQAVSLAYGGRIGGLNFPDVIYAGYGNQLLVRTSGSDTPTPVAFPGGVALDIVLDPGDYRRAYVLGGNGRVYRTVDAGASWVNVTGNLRNLTTDIRTIELYKDPATEALLVGGQGGVYRCLNPGAAGVWTKFGTGLPNAVAVDLHYDYTDNILLVGTYGRGAWTVSNADAVLKQVAVLLITGDTGGQVENDTIRVVRNGINPLLLDVFVNNPGTTPDRELEADSVQGIEINGLAGDDLVIIDNSNGVIAPPLGVKIDGGTGSDALQVIGTAGADGIDVSGSDVRLGSGDFAYLGMEHLGVDGGAGDDAVSLTGTANNMQGLLRDLTVRGGAGADTLSLNDQNNAATLVIFTITGAAVTRFDFIPAVLQAVAYDSISGVVVNAGIGQNVIDVNGGGAEMTINAGGGDDAIDLASASEDLRDLGSLVDVRGEGGNDYVRLHDRNNALNDVFTLTAGEVTRLDVTTVEPRLQHFVHGSVESLVLDGGAGNNVFNVTSTKPGTPFTINGGAGTDVFNVAAPLSADLHVDGEAPTAKPGDRITVTGPGSGDGTYTPGLLSGSGTVVLGSHALFFAGIEPLAVSGFATFTLVTPGRDDSLRVDTPANGPVTVSGTSGGIEFESLSASSVGGLILNTGANDGAPNANGRGDDNIVVGPGSAGAGVIRILSGGGTDVVTFNDTTANIDVAGDAVTFNAAGPGTRLNFIASQSFAAFNLAEGVAALGPGGDKTLAVRSFNLGQSATLDLTDNTLAVLYAGQSPMAFIRQMILLGLVTGKGIVSSLATASRGVGSLDNTNQGNGGLALVRYTLLGDANLDRRVDFTDLVRLAQNYNDLSGNATWERGDFTYDRNVDFNDLVKVAQAYNTSFVPGMQAGAGAAGAPVTTLRPVDSRQAKRRGHHPSRP
jgi:hypothetical protein